MGSPAQISIFWQTPGRAAVTVFLASSVTILAALAFEHLGGYAPCPLCLQQRYAYYAAIPLAGAAVLAFRQAHLGAGLLLLAVCGLAYLINAGLGVYHAGVEWEFWQGPASCAGGSAGIITDASELFKRLDTLSAPPCDKPSWRFLGISFAGYNALISAALAGIALLGILGAVREPSATTT